MKRAIKNTLNNKKKIVFLIPSARGGGAEKVILTLVNYLSRDIFEITLIMIDPVGPNLSMIKDDINFIGLGYRRVSLAFPSIVSSLISIKPDIVVSSIGHLNLALICAKLFITRDTKVIVRESNVPSSSFDGTLKLKLIGLLFPILYRFSDKIVCPGSGVKSDLENNFGIKSSKMKVIPNPLSLNKVRGDMNYKKPLWNKKTQKLVAAGRMARQKGFDLLIEAMKIIVRETPDAHLIILGDGPERKNLRRLAESYELSDHITFAGYQENVYPYYQQADIFLLPSRYEGLPNVVLETLACGTPVVAFNCPGSLEDILIDDNQGILVPPNNVTAFANSVIHCLKHGKNLSKNSLLAQKFHLENVIAEYERLFLEC